ncbi:BolA family protein [Algicola sagamiensis]|uniref:BolA family protein n=1 Tax=Algicola sagamiensis TaxID=163869 RepID=UPI000363C56C|nr:BolA family protein [Algicola sagamiensis]
MQIDEIKQILMGKLELDEVHIKADGSHFEIIAVGQCFESLSPVKKQQLVYGPLMESIADGTMHAVSIKTYTPEQWARDKKLMFPS